MTWRTQRVLAASILVVAVAGVVTLATHTVILVTTHGVSMLPRFHSGDLAILLPSSSYHLGEVVGYRSPLLHITVLHRIVADHNGLFTFKGDNNSFLDPVRVRSSAVVGHLVWRIPHGGTVLSWFRSPPGLAVLAFCLVATGGAVRRSRRRRPIGMHGATGRAVPSPPAEAPAGPGGTPAGVAPTLAAGGGDDVKDRSHEAGPVAARLRPVRLSASDVPDPWWMIVAPSVLLVVAAALAVQAFGAPAGRVGQRSLAYGQQAAFAYSARASAGVTYPTGRVTTGEPVFLHLVHELDIRITYAFIAPARTPLSVSGTASADVYLDGPNGWRANLATTGRSAFRGSAATITVPVNLDRLGPLATAFTRETGVPFGDASVVVVPRVEVSGRMDGQPVHDTFTPSLMLQDSGGSLSLLSSPSHSDPYPQLHPRQGGSVVVPVRAAATTSIFGHATAVSAARGLALILLALAVAGLAAGGSVVVHRRRLGDRKRIRARYGSNLVPVASSPASSGRPAVDVQSIRILARLADRHDCVILELVHGLGTAYYVDTGSTLYRYGAEPAPKRRRSAAMEVVKPAS